MWVISCNWGGGDGLRSGTFSGGASYLVAIIVLQVDNSRARAYYASSGCGMRLFSYFLIAFHFSYLSPSLWEMARYKLLSELFDRCCLVLLSF